jgi:hypothetical protein
MLGLVVHGMQVDSKHSVSAGHALVTFRQFTQKMCTTIKQDMQSLHGCSAFCASTFDHDLLLSSIPGC